MLAPVLLFLLVTHLSAVTFSGWVPQDRLPWKDESDEYNDLTKFVRGRRSDKITLCGGKVWKMVVVTCGGQCTSSETDIATRCCSAKCTMEEIMSQCCPSR